MTYSFYYGRFLALLGCFMLVAAASDLINVLTGLGLALILLGAVPILKDSYMVKNEELKWPKKEMKE